MLIGSHLVWCHAAEFVAFGCLALDSFTLICSRIFSIDTPNHGYEFSPMLRVIASCCVPSSGPTAERASSADLSPPALKVLSSVFMLVILQRFLSRRLRLMRSANCAIQPIDRRLQTDIPIARRQ